MAVLENTILAENVVASMDIEMLSNFRGELSRLTEILGIFQPEIVPAGTSMYQYSVTGTLNASPVQEGDEVPLSEYTVTKEDVGDITVSPYRKLTTAQAILKGGYQNAIAKTDSKMLSQVRADIVSDFFTFLGTGTGSATGTTLQDALAQAEATLGNTMETNGDAADRIIHFVNRSDIADYLGTAQVSMQTLFGMDYIENFLGISDIFVTNKVTEGNIYVTPVDNIHIYGVDFATLGDAGLTYTTQDDSLIGVHHKPLYERTGVETYVLSGAMMLPEVKDYIVKATISPAA